MRGILGGVAAVLWATAALGAAELEVTPTFVDLGPVPPTGGAIAKVVVVNVGDADANLDVRILYQEWSTFSIAAGGGRRILGPGERHVIWVGFVNLLKGTIADLAINDETPTVRLRMNTVFGVPCAVASHPVDFDVVHLGTSRSLRLAVGCDNAEPFRVYRPTSTSPDFRCEPERLVVYAGHYDYVTITYAPGGTGTHRGSILLDPEACAGIDVRGQCDDSPLTGRDLVGIWWDENLTAGVTDAVTAGTPFHAWLAMLNPSETVGVGGWELKLGLDEATLLTHVRLQGQAFNILEAPSFCVGIAEPLPYAQQVVLARW